MPGLICHKAGLLIESCLVHAATTIGHNNIIHFSVHDFGSPLDSRSTPIFTVWNDRMDSTRSINDQRATGKTMQVPIFSLTTMSTTTLVYYWYSV